MGNEQAAERREFIFDGKYDDEPRAEAPSKELITQFNQAIFDYIFENIDLDEIKKHFDESVSSYLLANRNDLSQQQIRLREAVVELFAYQLFSSNISVLPEFLEYTDKSAIFIKESLSNFEGAKVDDYLYEFINSLGEHFFENYKSVFNRFDSASKEQFRDIAKEFARRSPIFVKLSSFAVSLDDEDIPISDMARQLELNVTKDRLNARYGITPGSNPDSMATKMVNNGVLAHDIRLDDERVNANGSTSYETGDWREGLESYIGEKVKLYLSHSLNISASEFKVDFPESENKAEVTIIATGEVVDVVLHLYSSKNYLQNRYFGTASNESNDGFVPSNFIVFGIDEMFDFESPIDLIASRMRPSEHLREYVDIVLHRAEMYRKSIGGEVRPKVNRLANTIEAWRKDLEEIAMLEMFNELASGSDSVALRGNVVDSETYMKMRRTHVGNVLMPPNHEGLTVFSLCDKTSELGNFENEDVDLQLVFRKNVDLKYVPNVLGYKLVGERYFGQVFGYVRDESFNSGNGPVVDIRKRKIYKNFANAINQLEEIGATELADALKEKLNTHKKTRSPIPVSEIAQIISATSTYTFNTGFRVGEVNSIAEFANTVSNGTMHLQCTGANAFAYLLVKQIDPKVQIEIVQGVALDPKEVQFSSASHQMIIGTTKDGKTIIDPTPTQVVSRKQENWFSVDKLTTEHARNAPDVERVKRVAERNFNEEVVYGRKVFEVYVERISRKVRKPKETVAQYVQRREGRVAYDPVSRAYRAYSGVLGYVNGSNAGTNANGRNVFDEFMATTKFLENYQSNDKFFRDHPDVRRVNPLIVENMLAMMRPLHDKIIETQEVKTIREKIAQPQIGMETGFAGHRPDAQVTSFGLTG